MITKIKEKRKEKRKKAEESVATQYGDGYMTLVGMDLHSVNVTLCITRWRKGEDPHVVRTISTDLDGLVTSYAKNVGNDSLTVLEASTNAFAIVRRLGAAGYKATVLTSDAISGMACPDRVNDKIDARNLARAYSRGGTREVLVPDATQTRLRDIWFGHRNAVKETTRWSNRLWSYCSMHDLKLPERSPTVKLDGIRKAIKDKAWEGIEAFHAERMLAEYVHARDTRALYERKIQETVAENLDMTRIMQVLGVRFIVAFGLMAFIGDVRRFETSKKLVSYVGFNPSVNDSGTKEGKRKISHFGRRDLRSLMVEAAQSALNKGKAPMHTWARRKRASGKEPNKVVCALARKMVCHVWHILMGHPVPWTEPEASFINKARKLSGCLGKEKRLALGYKTSAAFVEELCARLRPEVSDKEPFSRE